MKPHLHALRLKQRGFLYTWTIGYWEENKFFVPRNLEKVRLYTENVFDLVHEISMQHPEKTFHPISANTRNEIFENIVIAPAICQNNITNEPEKETKFHFGV